MRLFTLKKNKEFRRVFNNGRSIANTYLVLYHRSIPGAQGVRFGFSVSKKIGNAVRRNRVRRRLKEICRLNQHKMREGFEVIIIARPPVNKADYATMEKSVLELSRRAKLLKREK